MRWFLVAIILLPFTCGIECEGSAQMGLPAVSGGEGATGGSIVPVEMHLVPGEGEAYVNVVPNTDGDLQESLSIASGVARQYAGAGEECDVLLSIQDNSEFVQGPSGGAAFAVMAYALFTGGEIRGDSTLTGAISAEGDVLPVGGVYEKALSAKEMGKEYFLTPVQSIDEKLLLREIGGITIYEVGTFEEARDFFFEGAVPEERPLNLSIPPLPPLPEYAGERDAHFRELTEGIIGREVAVVSEIEDAELREYYMRVVGQQEELVEKGYYYSAANGAFLNFILADSLSGIEDPDVEGKILEVEECLDGVEEAQLTYENYEWVMGAEARIKRAEKQLELFTQEKAGTREEAYIFVYELNYALAWCDAASEMHEIAEEVGGELMDAEVLKQSAEGFINLSRNHSSIGDSDNYVNGMEMYGEGKYAGAAYELLYALAFEKTAELTEEGGVMDTRVLNGGERKTLWGSTFQAHSDYLAASGDAEGAYAVALFSYGMEEVGASVGEARAQGLFAGNQSTSAGEECECPECEGEACAPALLLLLPFLPLFIKNLPGK